MPSIRLVLALAASLLSTGCFQMTTTVSVKPDGSGTITQRLVLARAAIAQLQQFAAANGKAFDPLSEDEARAHAAKLGPAVTYVSSTPIDDPAGQGRESIYAFKDISQLRVTGQPPAPGGATIRGDAIPALNENIAFSMTNLPNGNALLTVTMPQPSFGADGLEFGGARASQISPEQVAMAQQLFAGARLSVAIEPAGSLVRSSSAYIDGNRVTLLDVDFDRLIAGPALDRLRSATNADEARAALKDLPGLKVNLDPQITIEFTGK